MVELKTIHLLAAVLQISKLRDANKRKVPGQKCDDRVLPHLFPLSLPLLSLQPSKIKEIKAAAALGESGRDRTISRGLQHKQASPINLLLV